MKRADKPTRRVLELLLLLALTGCHGGPLLALPVCEGDKLVILSAEETPLGDQSCAQSGEVCASGFASDGQPWAECVDKRRIACTQSDSACSDDGTAVLMCGFTGYLTKSGQCQYGTVCKQGEGGAVCVFADQPCSERGVWCSADGTKVLECDTVAGFAHVNLACDSDSPCKADDQGDLACSSSGYPCKVNDRGFAECTSGGSD